MGIGAKLRIEIQEESISSQTGWKRHRAKVFSFLKRRKNREILCS